MLPAPRHGHVTVTLVGQRLVLELQLELEVEWCQRLAHLQQAGRGWMCKSTVAATTTTTLVLVPFAMMMLCLLPLPLLLTTMMVAAKR